MAKRIHSSNMFGETDRIVRATTVIETLHDAPIDWGRICPWLAERYLREGRWLTALSTSTKAVAHGHVAGVAAVLLPYVRHRLRRTLGLQAERPGFSPMAGRHAQRHGCGNSNPSSTTRRLHNQRTPAPVSIPIRLGRTNAGQARVTEVSVIIPTRNRSKLLELSLRSVLWQRNVDFETIVVDDGSTDDTPSMLRSRRSDPSGSS